MKYCGFYSNKINMKIFDEISIIYEDQSKELLGFLQEYPDQRINLIVRDIEKFYNNQEWIKLEKIKEAMPERELYICFGGAKRFSMIEDLRIDEIINNLHTIPYFTGDLATNFSQLRYLLDFGVSDVYIGENLGFEMETIKNLCAKYGAQVRAYPNVAQSEIRTSDTITKFFIRPQDVGVYEEYIDVFEFWGPLDRQKILRHIYEKRNWMAPLKDIILDFDENIDSHRILPVFAEIRKNCGKKCEKGNNCRVCYTVASIGQKLEEKHLYSKTIKDD